MNSDAILTQGQWLQREWGWRVFVLSASKTPVKRCDSCPPHGTDGHDGDECGCLLCHGFYAATDDPDRFAEMRRAVPNGKLAVRCGGKDRGSDIAVIDIDNKPAPNNGHDSLSRLEQAIGLLPDTRMAITGSGGLHLIYRHPGYYLKSAANCLASDLPGIDVKADGGYIVVPPSTHPKTGEPYFWCRTDNKVAPLAPWPEILTKLLTAAPQPKPTPALVADGRASAYAIGALKGVAEQIRAVRVGAGLHDAVRDGSMRVGTFVGAGLLSYQDAEDTLVQAAADAGDSNPNKTLDTITSGLRKGAEQPYGATA